MIELEGVHWSISLTHHLLKEKNDTDYFLFIMIQMKVYLNLVETYEVSLCLLWNAGDVIRFPR